MEYLVTVVLAIVAGLFARLYMLRRDYRQYPSYPQGWAIHLFIGFIGALIGAMLVPSFLEGEFAAVSFLLLAASQFREVRTIERDTLESMEPNELVPRGSSYIEGIARVFEARNYLSIWTALVVAIVSEVLAFHMVLRIVGSLGVALGTAALLNRLMRGKSVGDLAQVEIADVVFDGPLLTVAGVVMMNVGLTSARETFLQRGLGAQIKPNGPNAKMTLANIGQMQAIVHDVFGMVGVYMDVGEQEFTPIVRRDPDSGNLVVAMVPSEHDKEAFLEAIKNVPILEGSVRRPLRSVAGRMID